MGENNFKQQQKQQTRLIAETRCQVTQGWLAGTIVMRSSSFRVIALLTPSHFLPLLKHACREVTDCHCGHQEVSRCSDRGVYQGMYITSTSTKQGNKAEPTLTRNPKIHLWIYICQPFDGQHGGRSLSPHASAEVRIVSGSN